MTTIKEQRAAEAAEARDKLRTIFPAGSTVPVLLRWESRSGMSRCISVLDTHAEEITYLVARALGEKVDHRHGGIKVPGCGMDMGFHLVYTLSWTLYGREAGGYACLGRGEGTRWCPSNTHVNPGPDQDTYGPDVRHDDGYALSRRWV